MTNLLALVAAMVREDRPQRAVSWRDLVVQWNYAPIPPSNPAPDSAWSRGFNFLVLDEDRPTHFGRCRSSANERIQRTTDIRARLGEDPELSAIVPRTRHRREGDLFVEVSRYVSGRRFELDVPVLSTHDWVAATRRILADARRVTSRAETRIASLSRDGADRDLGALAAPDLAFLERVGFQADRCVALAAGLRAGGRVPPRVQHGDLWPGNVLRSDGDFVLLDFEVFGDVVTPLYDVLHFLRSCMLLRARAGASQTLLDVLGVATPDTAACQGMVREEAGREGLSRVQVMGVFVFYLVEMTAKVRRREMPEAVWRPYWRCLEALADRLRAGTAIDHLLLGPAPA